MSDGAVAALLRGAAQRYRICGRTVMHFMHGKLRHDPIFVELLRTGALRNASSLLDLGCGRGVLFALLLEAQARHASGTWPAGWPVPPSFTHMRGIELNRHDVQIARRALAPHAEIVGGDLTQIELDRAEVITLFDVLHYLVPKEQERLIDRIVHALDGAGTLLMRVGNPAAGWRHAFTQAVDRTVWAMRGHPFEALHCRDVDAWIGMLRRHGLRVDTAPMHQGTPFANVLLIAQRR